MVFYVALFINSLEILPPFLRKTTTPMYKLLSQFFHQTDLIGFILFTSKRESREGLTDPILVAPVCRNGYAGKNHCAFIETAMSLMKKSILRDTSLKIFQYVVFEFSKILWSGEFFIQSCLSRKPFCNSSNCPSWNEKNLLVEKKKTLQKLIELIAN